MGSWLGRLRIVVAAVVLVQASACATGPGPGPTDQASTPLARAGVAGVAGGDSFSSLVQFRTPDGMYAAPIHGAVTPAGRLLLFGYAADTLDPGLLEKMHATWIQDVDPAGAGLPESIVSPELVLPLEWHHLPFGTHLLDDSLVCGGATFLEDGRLMVAGGTRVVVNTENGSIALSTGLDYGATFDGSSWSRIPGRMNGAGYFTSGRWYPTLTRLADGRILVTGGFDLIDPVFDPNYSEEIFDPADNSWTTISTAEQTPKQMHQADYSAVFQLPSTIDGADVVMIGEDAAPVYLDTSTTPATWRVSATRRPGSSFRARYNDGSGTTMLPIRLTDGDLGYHNGSFLQMGGNTDSVAMSRADVYDPTLDAWLPTIETGVRRHYAAPVLLPDGRVLVINGHDTGPNDSVLSPQYIDPQNGFDVTTSSASAPEVRGYHNIAMLLPDGRVLTASGRGPDRNTSSEKPNYRYFSPSYMTKQRPVIVGAPTQLGYGKSAFLGTHNSKPVDAVLIALPSMTHAFDQNQRSIQVVLQPLVSNAANDQISLIKGPLNASIAPPGDYMLFAVDAERVPSVATMIRIG